MASIPWHLGSSAFLRLTPPNCSYTRPSHIEAQSLVFLPAGHGHPVDEDVKIHLTSSPKLSSLFLIISIQISL